jgi:hypothetical protein
MASMGGATQFAGGGFLPTGYAYCTLCTWTFLVFTTLAFFSLSMLALVPSLRYLHPEC